MIKDFFTKTYSNLQTIKTGIIFLLKIEKTYIVLHLLSCSITPLLPYIGIFFMARIINELFTNRDIRVLNIYVFLAVLLTIIYVIVLNAINYIKQYRLNQFYKNEKMFFAEKTMSLDYEQLENYYVKVLFERIQLESQSGHNAYFLYTFFGKCLGNLVSVIVAILIIKDFYLVSQVGLFFSAIALLIVLGVIAINMMANYKTNLYMLNYYDECVDIGGRLNFYYNFFKDYKTGKDVRMNGIENYVLQIQRHYNDEHNNIVSKTKLRCLKFVILNRFITDLLSIIAYSTLAVICLRGYIPIGDVAKYVACILLLVNASSEVVLQFQSLIDNNKYLQNYLKYLEMPSIIKNGTLPIDLENINEIEFKNVSFKYPGSANYALYNFSFCFSSRHRYAVVGINGSGKTTMIKLMCRLYNPTSGIILLNGIDIQKYDYDQYIKLFGVVFQDFKLFSFSLSQNIAADISYDSKKLCEVLNKVGIFDWANNLPDGIHTPLYKDFEESGIEISIGESQKIAIARAVYKNSKFMIMDEPTSALDPVAESEIYTQLDRLVDNKTMIFISHRLSSCLFCDNIIVLHEGKLIQNGSHEMLVTKREGKYYELWKSQQQHYI